MALLDRFFRKPDKSIEAAIRRYCVDGAKMLAALGASPPALEKKNLVNALTKVVSVCAGASALDFAGMARGATDISRALVAIGFDALLFEAAAWCLADFSSYFRRSPHIPGSVRPDLAEALDGAAHEIGSIFGCPRAALLLKRIESANALVDPRERVEYFGSLLVCDKDERGIVTNVPSPGAPDIRWETGLVLEAALMFHAKVMNPQVDSALNLIRRSIPVLAAFPP